MANPSLFTSQFLREHVERDARAAAILGGEYPRLSELLRGLPPLGGSLARDVRATATLWLAATDCPEDLKRLLTAAHEIPSARTVVRVADTILQTSAATTWNLPDEAERFLWYGCLCGLHEARHHLRARHVPDDRDFYGIVYAAGIFDSWSSTDDALSNDKVQAEVLDIGRMVLGNRSQTFRAWTSEEDRQAHAQVVADSEPAQDPDDFDYPAFMNDTLAIEDALRRSEETGKRVAVPAQNTLQDMRDARKSKRKAASRDPAKHVVLKLEATHRTSEKRDMYKMYESLMDVGTPLRVFRHPQVKILIDAWPHAADLIRTMLADLHVGEPVQFTPTLVVGSPGCGKTSLLQAITKLLELPTIVYGVSASADNSFGGTASRWSTAGASTPLELIRRGKIANPAVILDELEKGGRGSRNGSLEQTILPFLEKHTSAAYFETALDMNSDLSRVNFLATANDLDIPEPLKDRFRILRMPDPGPEHIGVLSQRIVNELARSRHQTGMIARLAPDEIAIIKNSWKGGSLRRLRRAVETLIDTRERMETRQ